MFVSYWNTDPYIDAEASVKLDTDSWTWANPSTSAELSFSADGHAVLRKNSAKSILAQCHIRQ